jgi:PPM family protein phosphatase
MSLIQLQVSVVSRTGSRERNEDAVGFWGEAGPFCAVLSDGAGGHGGGDIASQTSVQAVLTAFAEYPESSTSRVLELIDHANQKVIEEQVHQPNFATMRATLVVLTYDPQHRQISWGHIGDSRLYYFRAGKVMLRTKDHSLFQTMVDAGYAQAPTFGRAPDSSVLIASLGSDEGFTPDVPDGALSAEPGDVVLMCSDGFWEHFSDALLEQLLEGSRSPQDWLARLEGLVTSANHPGQDNYSALAVWCA